MRRAEPREGAVQPEWRLGVAVRSAGDSDSGGLTTPQLNQQGWGQAGHFADFIDVKNKAPD